MEHCAVFDLDGTLADTIPDIAAAVNHTRVLSRLEPLSLEIVKGYVGNGIRKLVERSFPSISADSADMERLVKITTEFYAEHPSDHTLLYPGVRGGLQQLHDVGWKLALFTNKPYQVAGKCLERLGLVSLFSATIGGGMGIPLKPDPAGIIRILKECNAGRDEAWMIGDNWTDLESAVNAGIHGAFLSYGYGSRKEISCDFEADSFAALVEKLLDLP